MRLLALDTAMDACSVAVVDIVGHHVTALTSRSEAMQRGHAEALIPMVDEVMSEAGIRFSDLDRVAVTIGPGSFTGTRIGVAAARAYALASGIDAVGVTTLQAVALNVPRTEEDGRDIIVAFDALRGEVYAQLFRGAGLEPVGEPAAYAISDAVTILPRTGGILVGSGAHLLAEASGRSGIELVEASSLPDPVCIARIGATSDWPAVPLYLRPPDAKPQAQQILRAG